MSPQNEPSESEKKRNEPTIATAVSRGDVSNSYPLGNQDSTHLVQEVTAFLNQLIIYSLLLSSKAKEKWLKYLNQMTEEERNMFGEILEFEREELKKILKKSGKDGKKMVETLRIFEKGLFKRFYRESEEKEKKKEDEKLRNMVNMINE